MNDKLLVRKVVNIPSQFVEFLCYLHPRYKIVNNLDDCDATNGIIYTGQYTPDIKEKINSVTQNWIIVNRQTYDVDLSTNEGLVKNLLPLHYAQIKKDSKDSSQYVYNSMGYGQLLEKVKVCLIDGSKIEPEVVTDQSVYNLFAAIICTPDILNSQFFNTVSKSNVQIITSALLTFLNKVQIQNIRGASINYSRLIVQSNKLYGKHIKKGIFKFLKSKANPEVSLHHLLMFLNKAR